MGTRGVVLVPGVPLAIYMQHDGYPDGLVLWALKKIRKRVFTNGLGDPKDYVNLVNFDDDFLGILYIALKKAESEWVWGEYADPPSDPREVKEVAGGIYLFNPMLQFDWADYVYVIKPMMGKRIEHALITVARTGGFWPSCLVGFKKNIKFQGEVGRFIEEFSR